MSAFSFRTRPASVTGSVGAGNVISGCDPGPWKILDATTVGHGDRSNYFGTELTTGLKPDFNYISISISLRVCWKPSSVAPTAGAGNLPVGKGIADVSLQQWCE